MGVPLAAALAALTADLAGTTTAPPPLPIVGTQPVASAELLVARPPTRSCVVELFGRRQFEGEARQPIAFTPPATCPGPWAKIVFEADFKVTAGEQFDRTGIVNLAGVNLFTGTTMEPRRALAPEWHVERDVTDYAALFRTPKDGEALLTNYVDKRYTGRIFWNARLVFYAADPAAPAAKTPDLAEPLTAKLTTVDGATPSITRTFTFPQNVERIMVDVLAVPQADDEFWYYCTPDQFRQAPKKEEDPLCGAPFRETEVRIDGVLAGFAPIYPWIYTGGMNPAMWTIVPGIETLNLRPYRVDLTPFAALLNDGKAHQVSLTVAGVHRYMFAMGTMLAWLDHGRAVVTGRVKRNALMPASIRIDGDRHGSEENPQGLARTFALRAGETVGYLDTSHGRVTTRVRQTMRFANYQDREGESGTIAQQTDLETRTTTSARSGKVHRTVVEHFPLGISFSERKDGNRRSEGIAVRLGLDRIETVTGSRNASRETHMIVAPNAVASYEPGVPSSRLRQGSSLTHVRVEDSAAGCYDRTITVENQHVSSVKDGCEAPTKN